MTLYDRVAATPGGPRRLADARLRHDALHLLWQAQAASKLSVEQLATELGVRRRAVRRVLDGDGDISVGTLARYLHAMGYEVEMRVVAAGEPRQAVVEQRETRGPGWLVAPGDWPGGSACGDYSVGGPMARIRMATFSNAIPVHFEIEILEACSISENA